MKNKLINYLKFLVFTLCFVGIPLIVAVFGYFYAKKQNYEIFIKAVAKEFAVFYTELATFSEQDVFWCRLFENEIIQKSASTNNIDLAYSNLIKAFSDLEKIYGFEYLVYHPSKGGAGNVASETLRGTNKEVILSLNYIWKSFYDVDRILTEETELAMGKVFGPQFYISHLNPFIDNSLKGKRLCRTDSTNKRKLLWAGAVNELLVMTFIKPEFVTEIDCIATYLSRAGKGMKYNLGFSIKDSQKNRFWHSDISEENRLEIEKASLEYEKSCSMTIETDNLYVFPLFLRPDIFVYGYLKKSNINGIEPPFYYVLCLFFIMILTLQIMVYGWKIFILQEPDGLSIKMKIAFLLFFANGLPLLLLGFIGNDFLKRAENDYIRKLMSDGTAFLQDLDAKYELEFTRCVVREEKIKREVLYKGRKDRLKLEDLNKFFNGISSNAFLCYIISSQAQMLIANNNGLRELDSPEKSYDGESLANYDFESGTYNKQDKPEMKKYYSLVKIGYYFLGQMNKQPINEKVATEVEIIIESLFRRKINNFIFDMYSKLGSINPMGFGHKIYPTLVDVYSLSGNYLYDYFMIYIFNAKPFQKNYLMRTMPDANHNELGLKVFSWSSVYGFIPRIDGNNELSNIAARLSSYPLKEPIRVKLNEFEYETIGEEQKRVKKLNDYIAMGFDCKYIKNHSLIGLYPVDVIKRHLDNRRKDLVIIAIFSLLLTLSLSFAIIKGFLIPLSEINSGVEAIKQKDFSHRLPELGRDEFGEMGKIFNNVMVELKELSVASAIQEQLLPSSPIKTGYFSLYGKSVAMGALGGDYFDFIEMEDDKFSIALGDVAGHGVGAALIMAMAKAGLIQLDSLWREPKKLISRLHQLIYMAKTEKQRKIMTFQYLYVEGVTGEAVFSNAGGCYPIIIRKSLDCVEELEVPGAALGAFKRAVYNERVLKLMPGDAIVFYTDGIVESKNNNGEMLGYESLKLILKNSWNPNAEAFYNNIYAAYLEYIGGDSSKADDDLTVVVLVYKGSANLDANEPIATFSPKSGQEA